MAGAQGSTAPVGVTAEMTPEIAAQTSANTLPPAAGGGSSAGGSSGWSLGKGINTLNQYLKDYQPLIQSGEEMLGMAEKKQGPTVPQTFQMPGLPSVAPPPQLDRLAFLRAFGVQG